MIREVAYPWHPWRNENVVATCEVTKQGQSFVHCRLEDGEVILAIPLWMFDRRHCSSLCERDTPEVGWAAVRELGGLLCDAAALPLEQEHSTVNPGGNAHAESESVTRSGSVESVSSLPVTSPVVRVANGSTGNKP